MTIKRESYIPRAVGRKKKTGTTTKELLVRMHVLFFPSSCCCANYASLIYEEEAHNNIEYHHDVALEHANRCRDLYTTRDYAGAKRVVSHLPPDSE